MKFCNCDQLKQSSLSGKPLLLEDRLIEDDARWCRTVSDNGIGMRNKASGSGSRILNGLVDVGETRYLSCDFGH
jgi:hypothetical protein